MEEKRRATRLYESISVRQRSQEDESIEETQANDISTGGLRMFTDNHLDVGSKLKIEINIPRSSRPYYAEGEVVWLKEAQGGKDKKFDMGVKFLRIMSKNDIDDF